MKTYKDNVLKELDNKFPSRNDCTNDEQKHTETCQGCLRIKVVDEDDLKGFIKQLLDQQKEDLIKKLDGEKKETKIVEHGAVITQISTDHEAIGFNQALDRAIEIIRESK